MPLGAVASEAYSDATLTTILPVFSPCSTSMKARGVFSKPSRTVSVNYAPHVTEHQFISNQPNPRSSFHSAACRRGARRTLILPERTHSDMLLKNSGASLCHCVTMNPCFLMLLVMSAHSSRGPTGGDVAL